MVNQECKKYLEQACINERLVLFLNDKCDNQIFFKWIFVVIYYTALSYFNAFLIHNKKTPPSSHTTNDGDGDVDMAKSILFTMNKNNITHAAGVDYEQLFQWSWDVRYDPNKLKQLLNKDELKNALIFLDGVKLIVFNELEYRPKFKSKKIKIEKVKLGYLNELKERVDSSLV